MNRRLILTLFVISFFWINLLKADEGMWLLPLIEQLNYTEMRELGLEISISEIYAINHSSIKDAIAIFGNGCTSQIVSSQGLLFTNHHCGYDQIQEHSSTDHNYLKDGFWAMNQSEELPNPGLEVKFLSRIEDVSEEVLKDLSDSMTEEDREDKVNEIMNRIEKNASEKGTFEAKVKSFFEGNKYYLCVYKVFKDIRLVGTPPSSIGKFGYDTDNWEWPRHTGDFCIFRVYTASDGSPAEFDTANIPLKPGYVLPVSLAGVEEDDFTLIIGFPGTTQRYLSSFGIRNETEIANSNIALIRELRLDILRRDMNNDPAINIKYASKYSRSSNYWKNAKGQNKAVQRLNLLEDRVVDEALFQQWANADTNRKKIYGSLLHELQENYKKIRQVESTVLFTNEALLNASEIIDQASNFNYLYRLLQRPNDRPENLNRELVSLKNQSIDFYKDYSATTDKKVVRAMLELYRNRIQVANQPDFFLSIEKKYKGDLDRFTDYLFEKSIFVSLEKTTKFLESPKLKELEKDPAFIIAGSVLTSYFQVYNSYIDLKNKLTGLNRLYLKGCMEMKSNSKFYPDANFTMRLSYGSVKNYSPGDAVQYSAFTALKGVIEKEDSSDFEFKVPQKLKTLYYNKDFGPYGKGGQMPVCFLTNNDITGGNSGSAVLNAQGQIVGLAFDGNWESLSSDFRFEPDLQRTICVDIRYVLFIIDKFAGAGHLIKELNIVNGID